MCLQQCPSHQSRTNQDDHLRKEHAHTQTSQKHRAVRNTHAQLTARGTINKIRGLPEEQNTHETQVGKHSRTAIPRRERRHRHHQCGCHQVRVPVGLYSVVPGLQKRNNKARSINQHKHTTKHQTCATPTHAHFSRHYTNICSAKTSLSSVRYLNEFASATAAASPNSFLCKYNATT